MNENENPSPRKIAADDWSWLRYDREILKKRYTVICDICGVILRTDRVTAEFLADAHANKLVEYEHHKVTVKET